MMDSKSKRCSICGVLRPRSAFSKRARACDRLQAWCRSCANTRARTMYANRPRIARPPRAPKVYRPRCCGICGETFVPTTPTKLFCGSSCAKVAGRKARLAYRDRPEYKERNRLNVRRYNEKNPRARRAQILRKAYGLTLATYDEMVGQQNGRCAICRHLPGVKGLAVDHDHGTGVVRALLCGNCNPGLGKFMDDPALLRAAASYLEHHCARLEMMANAQAAADQAAMEAAARAEMRQVA